MYLGNRSPPDRPNRFWSLPFQFTVTHHRQLGTNIDIVPAIERIQNAAVVLKLKWNPARSQCDGHPRSRDIPSQSIHPQPITPGTMLLMISRRKHNPVRVTEHNLPGMTPRPCWRMKPLIKRCGVMRGEIQQTAMPPVSFLLILLSRRESAKLSKTGIIRHGRGFQIL